MQDEKESNPRIYELGFLLVPTIDENDVLGEASRIKGVIESCGALLISDENPKSITLAYPIDKRVGKKKEATETKRDKTKEEAIPVSEAELDKTIEELVIY